MRARSLVLFVLTVFPGCRERDAASLARHDTTAFYQQSGRQIGYDALGRPSPVKLNAVVVSEASLPFTPPDAASLMVIRTADISIEVDSLEPAIAKVRQLAAQFGGYVANTDVTTGRAQLRNAKLELKVPAVRFDESLLGLYPIGKLESVSVEAVTVQSLGVILPLALVAGIAWVITGRLRVSNAQRTA